MPSPCHSNFSAGPHFSPPPQTLLLASFRDSPCSAFLSTFSSREVKPQPFFLVAGVEELISLFPIIRPLHLARASPSFRLEESMTQVRVFFPLTIFDLFLLGPVKVAKAAFALRRLLVFSPTRVPFPLLFQLFYDIFFRVPPLLSVLCRHLSLLL